MPTESSASPGVVEVKLRSVHQLFNELDPSPLHQKDLDDDVEEFIVDWAMEHPSTADLELRLHLTEPVEPGTASGLEESVRSYFAYKREVAAHRFRQLMNRGWLSLLIGISFLVMCLGVADWFGRQGDTPIYQIANNSFIIAGWVAMWRPMEIFLYDWWPLRRERRIFDRLSRATVRVVAAKQ